MKTTTLLPSLLVVGKAAAANTVPIVMEGTKFFFSNGSQFFIKGIAYQQDSAAGGASTGSSTIVDPLADADACKRDIPIIKAAGANVIRTYAIDPTADHSTCMSLLQDNEIYVISDLSSPDQSINRDDPTWNTDLYARYTSVINVLSKYDNVIGFFAGNEVTNNKSNTAASAYVKAAVRDSKGYIAANVNRWMGVGYAANDDAAIRDDIAHYFNCGNQSQAIDFWGYNIYEWCGVNTFEGSGYKAQTEFFANYSVPVFFSEYGCNNPGGAAGRIFQEVDTIYSSNMTDVISGAVAYMYFQEDNDYGLVSIESSSASLMKDYTSLSSRLNAANPTSTSSSAYKPSNSPAACPDISDTWQAQGDSLPPTPDAELCGCMFDTLSCVPDRNLNSSSYGDIFSFICGADASACTGINGDPEKGVYGAYLMCNSTMQLGYVLNQYYKNQNSAASACDFSGQASVTTAAPTAASCSVKLAQASADNSAAAAGKTASPGGGSSSSSDNFAPSLTTGAVDLGGIVMGVYAVVAMLTGAAVVLL